MIAMVFVDTNVFVYARDSSQQFKQELAAEWIARLWQEKSGRTSMQVLSEYYVTVTRKLSPRVAGAEAWTAINSLLAWQPQSVNRELLARAREVEIRHRISWWDSMIVAAAQLQNCSLLLTEDLQDGGVYGGVTARNPFTLGVNEPILENAGRQPQFSHPPRGRPARTTASTARPASTIRSPKV